MAVNSKNIMNRLYVVAGIMFLTAIGVVAKLVNIQFFEGEHYRSLAEKRTVKNFTITPNRGNIYADDGSLLATSVPKYEIRFDAVTVSNNTFEEHLKPLSDELSKMFGRPSSYYQNTLRKARANKNRYHLIARNLGYNQYMMVKQFPMFNLGPFKGGLIVEQKTVREHPIGKIAERTVGYDRKDDEGYYSRAGLEGAYGAYLRGKEGRRWKQKIANNQWKPIGEPEIEPEDGYDVISTINVNIQDIAHHALLDQLEKYKADHGCVVVMETETGEIKAISNLGRSTEGFYYERRNYAVWESHEPGSTFKLMSMAAALEDKVVDTSYVVDTENGILTFYGEKVRDSRRGGYGKITASEAFEVSSNTGVVKIIDRFYKKNPSKFVDRLYNMGLNKKLDLPITGEGSPKIPHPNDTKNWSGITLQWMAYGYNVSLTPLQTLAFYNAVANDGEMVRPRFVKAIKDWGDRETVFQKEIINPSILSKETIGKLQRMMENVVEKKHGTGHDLYDANFSMAGKTGTCQKNYAQAKGDKSKLDYISTFVGYFPADQPKYSCIVVIHEPDKSVGYYGADVSGPVFKRIAHKIYTDTPIFDELKTLEVNDQKVADGFEHYFETAKKYKTIMPNVKGMPVMDAISLLENMGLQVRVEGIGEVTGQSVAPGNKVKNNQEIILQTT